MCADGPAGPLPHGGPRAAGCGSSRRRWHRQAAPSVTPAAEPRQITRAWLSRRRGTWACPRGARWSSLPQARSASPCRNGTRDPGGNSRLIVRGILVWREMTRAELRQFPGVADFKPRWPDGEKAAGRTARAWFVRSAGSGRQKAREERELTLRPRSPLASGHLAAGRARPSALPPCRPPARGGHRGGVPSGGRGGGREGRVGCSRFETTFIKFIPCPRETRACGVLAAVPTLGELPPSLLRAAGRALPCPWDCDGFVPGAKSGVRWRWHRKGPRALACERRWSKAGGA